MNEIILGGTRLPGLLAVPEKARGVVLFAHGSGSSRLSPRNLHVARALQAHGFATLLFDLLTPAEAEDRRNVFDIALLAARVGEAIDEAGQRPALRRLKVGLFGASTGAAAALVAAAQRPECVAAVVSRGGRPDLAGESLPYVRAPTLMIVGGEDQDVIELNREARTHMRCRTRLDIIPGATHLFEEPGALDAVIEASAAWFAVHLADHR